MGRQAEMAQLPSLVFSSRPTDAATSVRCIWVGLLPSRGVAGMTYTDWGDDGDLSSRLSRRAWQSYLHRLKELAEFLRVDDALLKAAAMVDNGESNGSTLA